MRCDSAPFYGVVLCLGLTMLGAEIGALVKRPTQTITGIMREDKVYLSVMSATLVLQTGVWALCMFKKKHVDNEAVYWGFLALVSLICAWIGLTTVLDGKVHDILAGIFTLSFLLLVLIMSYFVWQPLPTIVLRLCLIIVLGCGVFMLIFYNTERFYLPEHVGFITYCVFFIAFFLVHPYEDWTALPDVWMYEENDTQTTNRLLSHT